MLVCIDEAEDPGCCSKENTDTCCIVISDFVDNFLEKGSLDYAGADLGSTMS